MKATNDAGVARLRAIALGGSYLVFAVALSYSGEFLGAWMIGALLSGLLFGAVADGMGKDWQPAFYWSLGFSLIGGFVAMLLSKEMPPCVVAADVEEENDPDKKPVFYDPLDEAEWNAQEAKKQQEREKWLSAPPPAPEGWKKRVEAED